MKRFLFLAFFVLATPIALAEELPDAYTANPSVYQFLFENERVRVMEMKLQPGEEIPMHQHDYPHSVYVLEAGQLTTTTAEGARLVSETKVGQLIWLDAKPHALKNTGTTTVRALLTEVKGE